MHGISGPAPLWLQVGDWGWGTAATVLTPCVVPPRPGQRSSSCSDWLAQPYGVWKIALFTQCLLFRSQRGGEVEVGIYPGQPFVISEGTEGLCAPRGTTPLRLIPSGMSMVMEVL